ncbi:MAG: CBASS cGAMP-activated phospholipase, partial [Methylophilaceae bacterium]|nr:CBASS cGAMP-activated phospholipase [Methylophilaceae bacterium]
MNSNSRKILSLDGGGIKGIFAASFLATIQDATGKDISEYFDLVAGTSTGGIIALGLGMGMSPREILQFYKTEGPRIFNQMSLYDTPSILGRLGSWFKSKKDQGRQIILPKYNAHELKNALERAFRSKRLGDSKLRLIIPAYHADSEDVYIFKTRHHSRLQVDWKQSAVNVALCTSAAPTYFAAHQLPCGSPLLDGGVWANNPVGIAAVEARSILGWKDDDLYILRLGCTESNLDIPTSAGLAGLLTKSTDLFMQGQSRGADGIAYLLTGHSQESPRYFPIQPKVPLNKFGLDKVEMINRLEGLGAAY